MWRLSSKRCSKLAAEIMVLFDGRIVARDGAVLPAPAPIA
jgi:hypothetical protein